MNVELLKSKIVRLNAMLVSFGRSLTNDIVKDEDFLGMLEKAIDGIGKASSSIKSTAKFCNLRPGSSILNVSDRSPNASRFKKESQEPYRKPSSPENRSHIESEGVKKQHDGSLVSNDLDDYPINLQFGKAELNSSRLPSTFQKLIKPDLGAIKKQHYSFDITSRNSVHRLIGGKEVILVNDLNRTSIINEEGSANNKRISLGKSSFINRNEGGSASHTNLKVSAKKLIAHSLLSDKKLRHSRKLSSGFSDLIKSSQIRARKQGGPYDATLCLSDRTPNDREQNESAAHVTIYDDRPENSRHIASKSGVLKTSIRSRATNIVANFQSNSEATRHPSRHAGVLSHRRTISSMNTESAKLVTPYKDRIKNIIKNQIKISINDLN